MILRTPTTTKIPTPKAILPIIITGCKFTCFETIIMLGSAHVISVPKARANMIMTNNFDCLDKELPMYLPTFVREDDAPIWNNVRPTISPIPPNPRSKYSLNASF